MPSRILRDGILTSVPVNSLSPGAELFYRRLMSVVDDYGRYYSNPAILRPALYPLRLKLVSEDDIVGWLLECTKQVHKDTREPLVLAYQADGKDCLQITKFKQQAKAKAKFPPPPQPLTEPYTSRAPRVNGSDTDRAPPVHLGGVVVEGGVGVVFGGGGDISPAIAGESKPSASPCPHAEIIKLYAQHLPTGRQVKPPWQGERAKHLQARWRELPERQSLTWWEGFFDHCSRSPFLTGKVPSRRPGEKPFEVSLDWIVSPGNFQKIIEGKYDE